MAAKLRRWHSTVALALLCPGVPVWLCGYGLADRTRARVETPRGVSVLAAAGESPEPNPWELLKSFGEGDFQLRQEEAARLLSSAALKQLGRWFQPAGERLSSETSDNVDEALDALLDEAKEHIVDFLSDRASPGPVSRVFWQAELYLRNFQQVAGEAPVEEFQQRAKVVEEEVAPEGSQMEAALGVVLARQQFVAASRFGYFLRRCQQRLRLERIMLGHKSLEQYVTDMDPEEQVELVRGASQEVMQAAEVRATELFGTLSELLRERQAELQLSPQGRVRLSVEAVLFGAALYDEEEAAAKHYELSFSDFGSRH
ncbi:Hypothetical protein (Fragment) [Durusdinium trenchii]|uniref:Uncharacterized protein n=1 Tax=Durusdinium trenchii TaxID=1381693 RepID=A0ABP0M9E3_9DINO